MANKQHTHFLEGAACFSAVAKSHILGLRQTEAQTVPAVRVVITQRATQTETEEDRRVLSRRDSLQCQSSSCSPCDTIRLPVYQTVGVRERAGGRGGAHRDVKCVCCLAFLTGHILSFTFITMPNECSSINVWIVIFFISSSLSTNFTPSSPPLCASF